MFSKTTSLIQVLIADNQVFFRQGIKALLSQSIDSTVYFSGEAANGNEAIRAVSANMPDVVLMNVHMPELSGIEATIILKQRFPGLSIIGLSCNNQSENVLAMVAAGCDGYLLKDTGIEELLQAIRTVHFGGSYFTPSVTSHLTAKLRMPVEHPLTAHEKQIVQMVCEGQSSKEIAVHLQVSKRTIDTYRERIMRKLGFTGLADLIRYAIRRKLIKA